MFPRVAIITVCLGLLVLGGTHSLFPGARLPVAITLATGWGQPALQARIDTLEDRAIAGDTFNQADRVFLVDLYRTMATGGRLSGVVSQTGRMMDHYLDGSGEPFALEHDIFTDNPSVRDRMTTLRRQIASMGCEAPETRKTASFYMPHPSHLDGYFGLYYGTLEVASQPTDDGGCALSWRAEVPWTWPSYETLTAKHGRPDSERFPLPNLTSLLFGPEHTLRVGNGLGGHLTRLGLARPFLAGASWREVVTL